MTVTVFGSILLLSLSAVFSFTSPVASSNPYEALTGIETGLFLALNSIRTLGGAIPNRLESSPVIWTEKNLVVSLEVPGFKVHWMPAEDADAFAVECITTTGTISSCGDNPP